MQALQMVRIIIRSAQRHSALIEKHCGVSGAQLWVIQEVHETPGLRIGDIAERLAIHQTTASNLVDTLVKKKCIDKLRAPEDFRAVKLVLSRHGQSVLKCAPVAARGLLLDVLARLNETQLMDLTKGLQALLQAVGKYDDAAALQPLPFTV
jgi:DNA-binding MarR family transcriptional regulator